VVASALPCVAAPLTTGNTVLEGNAGGGGGAVTGALCADAAD
jgi:hypothetical protein